MCAVKDVSPDKASEAKSTEGTCKVGLIGLGVMGENLALNIERNGFPIAIFNRTTQKVDEFLNGAAKGKGIVGCHDPKSFIQAIARPRKVILLVKAGDAVDKTIDSIKPYLDKGDIIIDGGNSHFQDTRRREKALAAEGFYLIGSGVSGGEEGALNGPSLMPGGDKKAYEEIRPIWEAIAAKVNDGPCVTYLGPDGAGHFVKMVHNGIEYGDMQLIAEVYDVLKRGLNLTAKEISDIFTEWNKGILDSFLIEITSQILSVKDPETGKPLVDEIVDKAGQKGTGKWTGEIALDLGIPIPTIDAALTARQLSAMKDERVQAAKILKFDDASKAKIEDPKRLIDALRDALYSSKICSYAQGMALIAQGSKEYNWNINLAECARIWKGGCIIRAKLLELIRKAFSRGEAAQNLLIDPDFSNFLISAQQNWRYGVTTAQLLGIPVPALSASLSYYDSYRSANLPQNLTQAQRDFFGAHTYELVGKPELGFVHSDWPKLIKQSESATSRK
jgi:6-phosphogluconate dehydrogenase